MDIKNYFFNHFYCKSVEEFINKLRRGTSSNIQNIYEMQIFRYFYYNKITDEKVNYIEKKIGLNISYYKNMKNKNIILNNYLQNYSIKL